MENLSDIMDERSQNFQDHGETGENRPIRRTIRPSRVLRQVRPTFDGKYLIHRQQSDSGRARRHRVASSNHGDHGSADTPRSSFRSRGRETKASQDSSAPGKMLALVTHATARVRAIQKKRQEIEEMYHQDCETFGEVVKMLISKDPSLEGAIQSSLQESLQEISSRYVHAMQSFIQEYDARQPDPLPSLPNLWPDLWFDHRSQSSRDPPPA